MGTLSIAASNVNSRIRNTGLSAKEIIMKRDAITNEPIHIDDNKLQDFKYEKRIQNHGYSEKSKSNGNPSAVKAIVNIGDIIHAKSDGCKHKARPLYLVTEVNFQSSTTTVQKLIGSQFRGKKYLVKFSEIYLASSLPNCVHSPMNNDSDNDIAICKNSDNHTGPESDPEVSHNDDPFGDLDVPLRRSTRVRTQPERLATPEIGSLLE